MSIAKRSVAVRPRSWKNGEAPRSRDAASRAGWWATSARISRIWSRCAATRKPTPTMTTRSEERSHSPIAMPRRFSAFTMSRPRIKTTITEPTYGA